jgi:hypothetical protein
LATTEARGHLELIVVASISTRRREETGTGTIFIGGDTGVVAIIIAINI